MRTKDHKLDALRSIEVLRDLPTRRLRRLVPLVDEVRVEAGTVLIHQGLLNRHAYFLESGSVSIDVDGERVATVHAGSIVGERTAIDHGVANATVTTVEPTTVFAVDHRALLGTAAGDEAFGATIRDLARARTNQAA
ncbi:MAG: cyclic nucleotide-binding domain-containing protein [Acidimicrobiales bacterium]